MGRSKEAKAMEENSCSGILGNNEIEDDLLIGLKMLALRMAKRIGHESLSKHFDLKTLRALSLTMMEYLKDKLKNSSLGPGFTESSKALDECRFSQLDVEDKFSAMTPEELWLYICPDKKRRKADMFYENEASKKKQKVEGEESS